MHPWRFTLKQRMESPWGLLLKLIPLRFIVGIATWNYYFPIGYSFETPNVLTTAVPRLIYCSLLIHAAAPDFQLIFVMPGKLDEKPVKWGINYIFKEKKGNKNNIKPGGRVK